MLNIPQKKSTALTVLLVLTFIIEGLFIKGCKAETLGKRDYGVFLNADDSSLERLEICDVYYYAPRKDIFDGLTVILQYIMTLGKEVIINGGDTYVTEYKERYGTIDPIMTGVNQETVWSHIDFAKGTFNEQNREEREYFCGYLESCKADGMEVYLLEYTANRKLIRKIEKYCRKQGFHFYISDSLELE